MAHKFMVGDRVQTIKDIDRGEHPFVVTAVYDNGRIDFDRTRENPNKVKGFSPDIFELVCNKHGVPGKAGVESIITPPLSECNERSLISMDKKYTCNGKPMRVLCVDRTGEGTSSAVVAMYERSGVITYFDKYGNNILKCCSNLVEVKPRIKRTVWVNVYPNINNLCAHASKAAADRYPSLNRLACVELVIDVEEGEGLE